MPEKPGAELAKLPRHTLGLQIHVQIMHMHGMGYPISDLHALVISSQNRTENSYQTDKGKISREDFYKTHNPLSGLALSEVYQIQYKSQTHGYLATRAPLPENDTPEYEQFVRVLATLGEFLGEVKKRERLNFPVVLNTLARSPQETLLLFARKARVIEGYPERLRAFYEVEILHRALSHFDAHLRYGDTFHAGILTQLSACTTDAGNNYDASNEQAVFDIFMGKTNDSETPHMNILAQMYLQYYPETQALLFRPDPSEQPA